MNILKQKVTGVLIIHNDCSLLKHALESAKGIIDELVVVDGAYKWVAPFCSLLGEDPNKSNEELISILNESKIPYKYFSGVWDSETHKREFSLQQANNDFIMLIDSDELFEVDIDELNAFFDSGLAIGDCYFPLYFSESTVGYSTGLKTPPIKAIFLNKRDYSVKALVDSLFLMVPEGERTERLANKFKYSNKVGNVHHLSLFRSDNSGFRRSRFYNLLAMRVNKKLNLLSGESFNTDDEFFELITNINDENMEALNNLFEFHRITAAFPNIKSNQYFEASSPVLDSLKRVITETYIGMLKEQDSLLSTRSDRVFNVFSSRPIFIDVSSLKNNSISFSSKMTQKFVVTLHHESSEGRTSIDLLPTLNTDGNSVFNIIDNKEAYRAVLEIIPRSKEKIVDFKYKI